jgi:branched-chain amino acid transport system permease protein
VVGALFGIPSLRIKGFYLAVATLAAQFFLDWMFARVKWFTNDSSSGNVSAPPLTILGYTFDSPAEKYLLVLAFVCVFALVARNLDARGDRALVDGHARHGRGGRGDRHPAAVGQALGLRGKLVLRGRGGGALGFVYLGSWEPLAFDVNRSFQLLFMVIIGGLGSILGSFLGAAFIVILPLMLNQIPGWLGMPLSTATDLAHRSHGFRALIIFFLIVEPRGLARLWAIGKEKLRLWPFPH